MICDLLIKARILTGSVSIADILLSRTEIPTRTANVFLTVSFGITGTDASILFGEKIGSMLENKKAVNDMRLGDLDALKETIHRQHYRLSNAINTTDHGMFTVGIDQAIDEQPAIDAVPVVRCSECIHYETCEGGKDFCCFHAIGIVPDDFCSYGERKDGNT